MNRRRLKIAWCLAEAASHALETDGRDLIALRRALAMWRDAEIDAVFARAKGEERRGQ